MNDQLNPVDLNSVDTASGPAPESIHAANGRRAKGAKSAHGKAMSARNSRKHGLCAANFSVLANEDRGRYDEYRDAYIAAVQPHNVVELELVNQIVEANWLLNRAKILERYLVDTEVARLRREYEERGNYYDETWLIYVATNNLLLANATFAAMPRYRAQYERTYLRLHKTLASTRNSKNPYAVDKELFSSLALPSVEDYGSEEPSPEESPNESSTESNSDSSAGSSTVSSTESSTDLSSESDEGSTGESTESHTESHPSAKSKISSITERSHSTPAFSTNPPGHSSTIAEIGTPPERSRR